MEIPGNIQAHAIRRLGEMLVFLIQVDEKADFKPGLSGHGSADVEVNIQLVVGFLFPVEVGVGHKAETVNRPAHRLRKNKKATLSAIVRREWLGLEVCARGA
jgi:hypothetical protein